MGIPRRAPLEMFKFSVYILLPIATIAYVSQPESIDKLIRAREYIVYPPEGKRPPQGSKNEIAEALTRIKADKAAETGETTTVPASASPAISAPEAAEFAKPNANIATPASPPETSAASGGWFGWIWGSK
ncbi:Protein PET100-like, mitochondrial [Hondaea fermentalgiana]|uniref:Protein PET100-like, mitochondrial n=1 Tax=Hondaea fermentalgiana TaxID=2315210 RepID=A0A2R5GFG8_9STRA|nr:Protein PET100-like, mitochondrial [Hondaea fermentalgiana]|eukprot:GBG29660.1 Protein PET100-like, mitochondrial [Hondaea fermentalgiana]